ncbi:MerR family transcriptional regulator [Nocardia sp. NBC_01503]|uniref:MerR family transcriptional regulator n=1 Tax=Nocardia sp. NBC_01503 TaxID=2975997 RepID=UPI002E7B9C74|nr:MerR family transcriptional regulator [Nocardia sp. NBC_01503]WTL31708.1 MerR family transcriptional regulator [Nocardia sp. NBC_01503]
MTARSESTADTGQGYPVRVVAERLGIPAATLRSWNQRYGIGPAAHQPGRHRLYSEADIALLERMHALIKAGATPAGAAGLIRAGSVIRGEYRPLLEAAFALDTAATSRLLIAHLRDFGVIGTWDELCRPAFAEIVARQGAGEGCIDVEHFLSWCVMSALHRTNPPPPSEVSPRVVLACTRGEAHSLPLEALRAALAERGVGAHTLGPDVPTDALADTLRRFEEPVAVVLWSQQESTALTSVVRVGLAGGARVHVGGPGWAEVILPEAAIRVTSLLDAVRRLT